MNYTDLQASIGRVQLRRQPEFAAHRRTLAARYMAKLAAAPLPIAFQAGVEDPGHALHLLVAKLPIEQMRKTRDEIVLELRERNIGASIHYPPLHTMPFYLSLGNATSLPVTEHLASQIMTLPISASMSLDDVDYIANHLLDVLA